MKLRTMSWIVFFLVLLPVSGAWAGEPELFELTDTSSLALGICQNVHRIADCSTYHVESVSLTVGGIVLDLEGRIYDVDWSGPGYYMESGAILQPLGPLEGAKASLRGQRWMEVYPEPGKILVSQGWKDQDGNRALSASDTLTLNPFKGKAAKALKVLDVRLIVLATPREP